MTAPNFIAASAVAHASNVRVDLASPPIGWGTGFVFSVSPETARHLAAALLVAADAADKHPAEKSTASTRGD